MTRSSLTIAERLLAAQVAIGNALTNTQIQDYLAEYGRDLIYLQTGQTLYQAALDADLQQKAEYGDQYAATDELNRLWKEANQTYMRYLKVARVAFKDDRGVAAELGLDGRRKQTLSGWIVQARQFYSNALANAAILSKLAEFSITQEKLLAGQSQVGAVEVANQAQEKERGEAQNATQLRDAAMEALDEWMSDFVAIARVALEAEPQLLEILGIVEPS